MNKKQLCLCVGLAALILFAGLNKSRLATVRMSANDGFARVMLENLAHACEYYAKDHNGQYPPSLAYLNSSEPIAYVWGGYCDQTFSGFTYTCKNSSKGYTLTATPVELNKTGSMVMTIETGGVLSPYSFTPQK